MRNTYLFSILVLAIINYKINFSQGATIINKRRIRQTNVTECVPPIIPNANIVVTKQKSTKLKNILNLNITCNDNYVFQSSRNFLLHCINGFWDEDDIPECKRCVKRDYSTVIDDDTDSQLFCPENALFTECGQRNYGSHQPFIVNGSITKFAEFPWHVAIYKKDQNDSQPTYQCGGSIITEKSVLTVAHCLSDHYGKISTTREYHVAAGKFHSKYNSDRETSQNRKVVRIDLHPSYEGVGRNYAWDIAVVILDQPFQISSIVHPVCIDWKTQFENEHFISGKYGEVAGWGKTEVTLNGAAAELRVLKVPYIEREQCNRLLPNTFIKFVTFDKFCAGHMNGSSVCGGDSGGGLVFERLEKGHTKYYIRGVVSVGPAKDGTCDSYEFTSYTRVSKYIPFIRESIQNLNVTTLVSPVSTTTDLSYDKVAETTVSCTTPNKEKAECISLYDCKILVDALKYYQVLPDVIKFINESQCGELEDKKVCCGSKFNYLSMIHSNPVTIKPTEHRNLHLLPKPGVCGRRLPKHSNYHYHGEFASVSDFPWMARLGDSFRISCEGFLINERYVMTSAYCAKRSRRSREIRVYLVENETCKEFDCHHLHLENINSSLFLKIEEIISHPLYNSSLCINDIALLRLAKKISYTDFVKPICLPLNGERSLPGRQMAFAGWGSSHVLRKGKLIYYILPIDECIKENNMNENDICIFNEITTHKHRFEAGGPLMATLTNSSDIYAEGILGSFKLDRHMKPSPFAITKLTTHMDWILDTIRP